MEWTNYRIRVPKHITEYLEKKLAEILEVHKTEIAEFEATKESNRFKKLAQRAAFQSRGRRLTIHNLIRIALSNGLPAVDSPKNALPLLAKYGIQTGRPRERN